MSAGTLTLHRVRDGPARFQSIARESAPAAVYGPQFPELHMYAPFVHDGASFEGYHPRLVLQSREFGAAASLRGGSLLLLVLVALVKLL